MPRVAKLAPAAAVACCFLALGCLHLFEDLHEGEACEPLSWTSCGSQLWCCLTAASAPANRTLYCAKLNDCIPGQVGEACDPVDDVCAEHLACDISRCGCFACGCGTFPDWEHCCPGKCLDGGGCVPGQVDAGPGWFDCSRPEGHPCSASIFQLCKTPLTCCHITSDWDAGPVCVASETACATVGLGEPCVMDRDCMQPLWCSRERQVCARCPKGCDGMDAGPDARPRDGGADAYPDAVADANLGDALAADDGGGTNTDAPLD
jgi:hypothetical protein